MSSNEMLNSEGKWVEATPEPFYASPILKILHFFGRHIWTLEEKPFCLICDKEKIVT